ncbi:MAG TPA: hypothetical protein VD816_00250 [Ohtaekwangia sp.]|nr:hypothetical protein [Ohtaekwangia sp.]
MKKIKKAIRLFALILIVLISSLALVTIFPNYRERYLHKEVRMEQTAKKREDEEAPETVA